jgi:hypothetical protein
MFRTFVRSVVAVAATAFVLHYSWESLHLPLYSGYEGLSGPLPITLFATLGDVLYTLLTFALLVLIKRDLGWVRRARHSDYAALAAIGLAIAVSVEYKAQTLMRWEYTDAMPTILGFGLSPLLQMTVLLPLSVFVAQLILKRYATEDF